MAKGPMDVDEVVDGLCRAPALQQRSVAHFTTASASLFGLEFQSVGEKLWEWAELELAASLGDPRRPRATAVRDLGYLCSAMRTKNSPRR